MNGSGAVRADVMKSREFRSLESKIVFVDEVCTAEEVSAICDLARSGVSVFAVLQCESMSKLVSVPTFGPLIGVVDGNGSGSAVRRVDKTIFDFGGGVVVDCVDFNKVHIHARTMRMVEDFLAGNCFFEARWISFQDNAILSRFSKKPL